MVNLIFVEPDGAERAVSAKPGDVLMEVAVGEGVEGIRADCGGSMVCGTCHCVLTEDAYGIVGAPSDDELEMLENGLMITPTSRLTCQVIVTQALDGARIRVAELQG